MIEQKLTGYLREVLGEAPSLTEAGPDKVRGVPLFLLHLYRLLEVRLFGRPLILAVAMGRAEPATPSEYARHVSALQAASRMPVALVLPELRSYERIRLVRQGVAFVVPGRQLFLPHLMIDLREHFPRTHVPAVDALSAAAQATLLFHLEKESLAGRAMRDIAQRVVYSAMTLSKVARELAAAGLCEVCGTGRVRTLAFTATGKALWERALPLLRNPVRSRRSVRWPAAGGAVKAGVTALAAYTDLSDDEVPTYAVRAGEFAQLRDGGHLTVSATRDEADAVLELWCYSPGLLAVGNRADRLSLFLSLQGAPDERVGGALADLLKGVTW